MTSLEQIESSFKAIFGTIPGDMWLPIWALNPLLINELKEIKQRQSRLERACAEGAMNDIKFYKRILTTLEDE